YAATGTAVLGAFAARPPRRRQRGAARPAGAAAVVGRADVSPPARRHLAARPEPRARLRRQPGQLLRLRAGQRLALVLVVDGAVAPRALRQPPQPAPLAAGDARHR